MGLLRVTARNNGSAVVVAPEGRIDQATAEIFQTELAAYLVACGEGKPPLVLDFSGVPYISSIGLRVLMLASRQVAAQKGRLAIAAMMPLVSEVFEISRFNLLFRIFDSVDTAASTLAE
jgi:anti-anti-sigma factor